MPVRVILLKTRLPVPPSIVPKRVTVLLTVKGFAVVLVRVPFPLSVRSSILIVEDMFGVSALMIAVS